MSLTPEAKRLLADTIRGTAQDPERGLRARLLRAIHDEADRRYRLSVPLGDAGLDEAHRRRRERIEAWIDERTRAAKTKTTAEEKATRVRLLAQAEKEAAATLINRLVVLRQLEALGLSKPAVLTGGWTSKGYREFQEFGRTLCSNGTTDATEGYATLLQLLFDELAIDLPGLFGDVGLTRLFPIPPATLREVVEKLDDAELASAWADDTTLGWIYQFWNDFERDALDEKVLAGGKVEPHELASKTQMFTDRYIVEWLLQNSVGLTWLCMCRKHGWTPDADEVLGVLDARRADWRKRRDVGEIALDALMPIEGELEEQWKYFVPQPLPDDAIKHAPDSVRTLKVLDPAVGSGHFLVIAFGLLAALYREEARHRRVKISEQEIAESIIENNLHGIDIDPRAIQIAAAGLYLKTKSLARDAHPKRMNLVAPVLQLGNLPKDDPAVATLCADLQRDVGIPEVLTNKLLGALAGVDYLGSLLKVDAAIDDAIRTVELSFEEYPNRRPRPGLSGLLSATKKTLLDKLTVFLAEHSSSEDLGLRLDGEQLAAGVRFVRMAREGIYDVVVGNPPYQGLSKTSSLGYVSTTYVRGKADLCAAFLERGLEFVKPHGLSAMVAMRSWMFIGQFSDLRGFLLHEFDLRVIGDLDKGAFESMPTSQLISVAMTVFRSAARGRDVSVALQPTAPGEKYWGSDRTDLKRAAILAQRARFEFDPRSFAVIDGEPIVYWWSPEFLREYADSEKLGALAPVKLGVQTSDTARFLRMPWEVRHGHFEAEPSDSERVPNMELTWAPYIKGAAGKVWIEPLSDVVRWRSSGLELKVMKDHQYSSYSRHIQSEERFFTRGVAFSTIGAEFSARAHRFKSIIDNMGASVFVDDTARFVCLLNTQRARFVLASLNPTVHFTSSDVNRLPILSIPGSHEIELRLQEVFSTHEAGREPSIEFRHPEPSAWDYAQVWAQASVDRPTGTPLPPYLPQFSSPAPSAFISFAIGVALGRFGGRAEGILVEAPLASLPSGLLFVSSDGGDSLDHTASAGLESAWEEHGAAVGEGDDLRTHLRTSFFPQHKKLYKNRPIYFPLSSARKNFVAFVSIHRWQADSLSALLADHLVPTKRRLDGELDDLKLARATGANKRQAERRFAEVQRLLEELNEFIGKVTEVAERGPPPTDDATPRCEVDARYEMDLDDGVMVNSAALWPLLEPQWKDPKKWWRELANAKGKKDYDWSHLAARYFPTRVRKKCQEDPSLAVAHECFWELHPAKAYAWELRLQAEIRPDFTIDEPGSDAARMKFLADHEWEAAEIHAAELKRRARKAAKADDSESGPLFEPAEGDDAAEESSDD